MRMKKIKKEETPLEENIETEGVEKTNKVLIFLDKGTQSITNMLRKIPGVSQGNLEWIPTLERRLAKRYDKDEFYKVLNVFNRSIFSISVLFMLSTLVTALFITLIPPILTLFGGILFISVGTLSFKYLIDITSLMDNIFNEVDKKKQQEKNINFYYLFIALNIYNILTSALQFCFQDYFDKIFVINQYLATSKSTAITPEVANILWGSPIFGHCIYLIPGVLTAVAVYYGRNYEIYQKWPLYFERWAQESWFTSKNFYEMFIGKRKPYEPYLLLGVDMATDSFLSLSPIALANNMMIQGPIGVGKSQAIFRPLAYQFYAYFLQYIKQYTLYRKKYKDFDKFKKKFFNRRISGKMLNGFVVIEPSNDLALSNYEDFLDSGMPKEMMTYINPKDPKTPGFNVFQGPVDKVVTIVSDLLYEFAASSNAFFDNKQKVYLTKMLYLLKLSAFFPNALDKDLKGAPTFESFTDMLDNNILWQRKEILKNYYKVQQNKLEQLKAKGDPIEVQDFIYKLKIIENTLHYWETNLFKDKDSGRIGNLQEEYVQGLIAVIENISSNFYIKRVFFQDTDFNIDTFLKFGGFLIINTAKDVLGKDVALFAKLISVALQSAAFRRPAYDDPILPLMYDEHPEYITSEFTDFITQNRKYNMPVIVACQSRSQYSKAFDENFTDIVFGNLRNKFVFQDVTSGDAEWWSEQFGKKHRIVPSYNTGDFNFEQNDIARSGVGERSEEVPNISSSDLMTLGKFVLAGHLTEDGLVKQYVKLKATPAFELTDSLPLANVDQLNVWWQDYQEQMMHDNLNARDDFALSTENNVETEELIEKLLVEERKAEMKNAPAQKMSRFLIANQVKEEEEKQKATYETSQMKPQTLEDVTQGVFKGAATREEERKSMASLLLNAAQETEEVSQ